jgi:hypothetical protein
MLCNSREFGTHTLEQKGMNCRMGDLKAYILEGSLKAAYLALLEHLRYGIRRQTTSIGMSSALSNEIAEHGAIILPFRNVDCPKFLRRLLHEMSESRQAQSPYPRGLDERAKRTEIMVDRNLNKVTGEMCPAAQ